MTYRSVLRFNEQQRQLQIETLGGYVRQEILIHVTMQILHSALRVAYAYKIPRSFAHLCWVWCKCDSGSQKVLRVNY